MDSRIDESIATSIAQERRPVTQIGGDIDYARVTRRVGMLLAGVIGLVVVLLGLSFVIKVDEVARAPGEFTPVDRVQVIQTTEGGAIESIMVRNGEQVQKGQLIARFRGTELVRDLERTALRLAYLQIQIERLDAFAARRSPAFTPFEKRYPEMVTEAQSLFLGQVRHLESSLEQVDRQIDEAKSEIAAAQKDAPAAKSSMDASRELLERIREGANAGIIPRNRVAQVEEQAAQAQRVYTQLMTSLDQQAARIKRLQAEREAIIAKSAADARNQRAEFMEQLDELKATEAALRSRFTDIEVRAPVGGIVQKISETRIGTVIPPGGTVCEIVPTDGGVLLQARVSPRDIGFVHVGQKANVKSDAFDFSRFGTIPGRVVRVAASNTQGEPGQAPYIMVEIELDQPYVGVDKEHVVTPGMTGEATILTGEKTVFRYLLKPIYYTVDTALRER